MLDAERPENEGRRNGVVGGHSQVMMEPHQCLPQ